MIIEAINNLKFSCCDDFHHYPSELKIIAENLDYDIPIFPKDTGKKLFYAKNLKFYTNVIYEKVRHIMRIDDYIYIFPYDEYYGEEMIIELLKDNLKDLIHLENLWYLIKSDDNGDYIKYNEDEDKNEDYNEEDEQNDEDSNEEDEQNHEDSNEEDEEDEQNDEIQWLKIPKSLKTYHCKDINITSFQNASKKLKVYENNIEIVRNS